MKPFSHGFLILDSRGYGGFLRFAPRGHGMAKMCLPGEGCELLQVIIFYGVLSRHMYIKTRYVF